MGVSVLVLWIYFGDQNDLDPRICSSSDQDGKTNWKSSIRRLPESNESWKVTIGIPEHLTEEYWLGRK